MPQSGEDVEQIMKQQLCSITPNQSKIAAWSVSKRVLFDTIIRFPVIS